MARTASTPSLNFLRQRRQKLSVLRKQDSLILTISIGFMAVVLLVTLGLIAYTINQDQQLNKLKGDEGEVTKTLASMTDKEAEYLVYSARLKTLAIIWPMRGSQQKTLDFLTDITMTNVSYQQVTFDQTKRLLEFSVVTTDYFALEEFITLVRTPAIQDRLESFAIGGVRRDDQGRYSFSVDMQLKAES